MKVFDIMKQKFAKAFMKTAHVFAGLSYCVRRKVGCVVISPDDDNQHRIVSIGYNGTPSGDVNICETPQGITKPEVIHAEMNAIYKLRKDNVDMTDMVLFCTTAPCPSCASEIAAENFSAVYYSNVYHTEEGLDHLRGCGIDVIQID